VPDSRIGERLLPRKRRLSKYSAVCASMISSGRRALPEPNATSVRENPAGTGPLSFSHGGTPPTM
jgi:hypothetical protein